MHLLPAFPVTALQPALNPRLQCRPQSHSFHSNPVTLSRSPKTQGEVREREAHRGPDSLQRRELPSCIEGDEGELGYGARPLTFHRSVHPAPPDQALQTAPGPEDRERCSQRVCEQSVQEDAVLRIAFSSGISNANFILI